MPPDETHAGEADGRVGELLHRITDDVKTIARNEVDLARLELRATARHAAADAVIVVLGGLVALIGLGLLCTVAVVALAPLIPPLWLRLLMMAIVYLAAGGAVARVSATRLQHDVTPDLELVGREAQQTVEAIRAGVRG